VVGYGMMTEKIAPRPTVVAMTTTFGTKSTITQFL